MNIIAVDFDNTLALGNVPIKELKPNIPLIERLKKTGCFIKVVTARGGKNKLSLEERVSRYYDDIKEWLDKHDVPYNQISFNKEYAHLYIDDMTIDENADFSTVRSEFTNNSIIFTERSCIKKCQTSKSEFEWYKIARKNGFLVPDVLFCNDELIITERIKQAEKPNADQILKLVSEFSRHDAIHKHGTDTYIENLKGFELPKIDWPKPTFYHGDLSTHNVLAASEVYLIDPNFKGVFGSYTIDAGKAAFSFYAYENDLSSARQIWNKLPESIPFTITEGMRVCKHRDYYSQLQNLRRLLKI
jgi:tRNA A-37 threonylcarbamoyl transferase component Bud32